MKKNKKVLLFIICLFGFVFYKKASYFERNSVIKRDVKLYMVAKEEKDYPMISIADDDGMIYIDKENFEKVLRNLSFFEYIKSSEDKVVFKAKGYRVEVDFKEKKLKKKFMAYENVYDEIEAFHKNIKERYKKVLKIFINDQMKLLKEKEEIDLKSLGDSQVLIYDIITTLDKTMTKDSKEIKKLCISPQVFDDIYMSKKTNEYSFEILKEEIENLVGLGLVDIRNIEYLDKNREKFINNFYEEISKFSYLLGRGHFKVVSLKKMNNNIYAMEIGETSISETGSSLIKIIDKNTAYLKIAEFSPAHSENKTFLLFEELEKSMDIVSKYKNLIIDVRNNNGGYAINMMYLISLLTNDRVYEYFKDLEGNKKVLSSDLSLKKYDGNIIVLVDKESVSGGTVFPSIIKNNNLGVVIGEKTGGQTDLIKLKKLPNGIKITSSQLKLYTDKDYNSLDYGMEPDILVDEIATIKNNDPILSKAMEYINSLN